MNLGCGWIAREGRDLGSWTEGHWRYNPRLYMQMVASHLEAVGRDSKGGKGGKGKVSLPRFPGVTARGRNRRRVLTIGRVKGQSRKATRRSQRCEGQLEAGRRWHNGLYLIKYCSHGFFVFPGNSG